jgi:hypothetical protein
MDGNTKESCRNHSTELSLQPETIVKISSTSQVEQLVASAVGIPDDSK